MEKRRITNKLLKEFYKRLPSVKLWYDDGTTGETMDIIKNWVLPDEAIERAIENSIECEEIEKYKKKNYNLNGLPEYYLNFTMRLLKNDQNYYSLERLKKCLSKYCELSKIITELDLSFKSAEDDNEDQYDEYKGIFEFLEVVKQYVQEDDLMELEKIIENNLDIFVLHEDLNWRYEVQNSPKYLSFMLQRNFPFSKEFLINHFDIFHVGIISKNSMMTSKTEIQQIIFSDVLKSTLEKELEYFTKGNIKHDFVISEELRDEMVLKFNL